MIDIQDQLHKDLEAVRQISIVPMMLDVICQTTGMGFAAIARVTSDRWLACSVRDEVQFGLKEGGELQLETTICNEVRGSCEPVIIENVDEDPYYKTHHTPKIYGLQSYISFPIFLINGTFFGTLCAIDSKPAKLKNTKIIGTFKMFAELLSFHLQSLELLERSYNAHIELHNKNKTLVNTNFNLDNFVYTASHDLKAPVSNIKGLLDLLHRKTTKENLDREEINKIIEMMKVSLNRFSATINELTTLVKSDKNLNDQKAELINVHEIIENVKQDLYNQIVESKANIKLVCEGDLRIKFSKANFKSILYNLINNAIKYRSPERVPEIFVKIEKVDKKIHLSVKDNGLGIPSDKQDKIFLLSNRLHDHVEGSGIGLFIVKRIVDKNKGQIKVESIVNQGTTFTIIY